MFITFFVKYAKTFNLSELLLSQKPVKLWKTNLKQNGFKNKLLFNLHQDINVLDFIKQLKYLFYVKYFVKVSPDFHDHATSYTYAFSFKSTVVFMSRKKFKIKIEALDVLEVYKDLMVSEEFLLTVFPQFPPFLKATMVAFSFLHLVGPSVIAQQLHICGAATGVYKG